MQAIIKLSFDIPEDNEIMAMYLNCFLESFNIIYKQRHSSTPNFLAHRKVKRSAGVLLRTKTEITRRTP